MVIYADVIFLINFISAYVMLYLLGKFINKVRLRKIRVIAASVIGAASAVIVFIYEFPMAISYIIRIFSVILMVFTAFFEQRKQLVNQLLWLTMMSGMMIFSMILLAIFAGSTMNVAVKSGVVYFDIPQKLFLAMFVISYFVMIFFIKVFKNRKNKKYYVMSVTHNDRTITVPALFDSGNLLKEPVTGKYVSIVEWGEVKKLFDADYEFSQLQSHAEDMKLWVVPFNSLGMRSGMLFAFIADSVAIPEEKKVIDKTFIGIYGNSLSKNKEYHALINAGLL